jgi:kinesin family protein 6/9
MSQISVYARVRPSVSNPYEGLTISDDSVNIAFGVRNDFRYVQPQFKEYTFKFKRVFENTNSSQEDVYDTVAQHMVDKFMDGFNGTIFAYGQTASGKTYTIEGSSRQYKERGLAPRVISEVYRLIKGREENENIALTISYMEIYQDQAYDLLNASNRGTTINTTLPKVTMLEVNGETYFKNLSTHLAPTEQVALHLLFEGGTCRKVAETVMNLSSSHLHTIFTVTLTSQLMGTDTCTKSRPNQS